MGQTSWPSEFEELLRAHLPLLGAERITGDLRLADHGLDSIATVSLLLDLEDRFAVSIPDDLLTATTFGDPAALWAVLAELRPELTA